MAAFFKTKSVTVSQRLSTGEYSAGETRTVNLQPMAANVAYETFGVEVSNAYALYDDVEAESSYELHGRVEYGARTFAIVAVPRVWDDLPGSSHIQVLLEEVREA